MKVGKQEYKSKEEIRVSVAWCVFHSGGEQHPIGRSFPDTSAGVQRTHPCHHTTSMGTSSHPPTQTPACCTPRTRPSPPSVGFHGSLLFMGTFHSQKAVGPLSEISKLKHNKLTNSVSYSLQNTQNNQSVNSTCIRDVHGQNKERRLQAAWN